MHWNHEIFFAFHIIAASGISLILLGFIVYIIKRLGRLTIVSEISRGHAFIAIGMSTYLFNITVYRCIDSIGKYLRGIWGSYNPNDLVANPIIFEESIAAWFLNAGVAFTKHLLVIPFTRLIMFISVWLFICYIFGELQKAVISSDGTTAISPSAKVEDNPVLRSLFTFITIVGSLYLCVASIIAVPEFENLKSSDDQEESVASFSINLQAQNNIDAVDIRISTDQLLDTSFIKSNPILASRIEDKAGEFNRWVNARLRNDELMRTKLISRIQSEIELKIADRELIKYMRILSDHYINHQNILSEIIQQKRKNLLSIIQDIELYHNETLASELEEDDSAISNFESFFIGLDRLHFRSLLDSGIGEQIPDRPNIGEDFGFFSQMSGWLLKTESPSLALIVGLFGFGLLGSMSSVFIRKRINMTEDDLILSDIPGVLINGVSAAILVFLVVKGAIVIFGDGGDLNPYALFFSCLVASVFSENIWLWARNKQQRQFSDATLSKEEQRKEGI